MTNEAALAWQCIHALTQFADSNKSAILSVAWSLQEALHHCKLVMAGRLSTYAKRSCIATGFLHVICRAPHHDPMKSAISSTASLFHLSTTPIDSHALIAHACVHDNLDGAWRSSPR